MKLVVAFILSIYTFGLFSSVTLAQSPSPTSSPTATPASVNSFELFWPIVAGRTQGDSFYFIKSFKEKLREVLMFSSFKKADYNITLSVKRTVEAEKLLLEKKNISNIKTTLEAAQQKRDKAYDFINKAKAEGKKVDDLINTLNTSLEKQEQVLVSLKLKIEDEAKTLVDENISQLNSLQSKLLQ